MIVTSYNYARYVGTAVDSVLAQEGAPFEVIVVDDGSTDETRAVLSGFGDRVRAVFQPNHGKSVALNQGIAMARGRYLAFLDSDDCLLPGSLAARLEALEADPGVGLVYGRALAIDHEGRRLPHALGCPERYPGSTLLSLLHGVFIPFLTVMVRRDSLEAAGPYFDAEFGATNDWELYLRLSRVCRFIYLDRPLALYRVHGSNWSANPVLMAEQMTRVVAKALSAPDLPPTTTQARPTILRNLYTDIGRGFVASGPYRPALQYFGRAMHVSGRPVCTAARIAYLLLADRLSHHRGGAWVVSRLAAAKQRLNYAQAGRHSRHA